MGQLKSLLGIARAFLPVLYCGYLFYYFVGVGGSVEGLQENGLVPTVTGLGFLSLLFNVSWLWKIVKFFRGPRPPGGKPRAVAPTDDEDDGGAAADAIIARYMARKAVEDALPSAAAPLPRASAPHAPAPGGPAKRPSFGRKPV